MSKIVLSYSRYHFDPKTSKSVYGTGYISSHLWRYLHDVYPRHEIIYCDYNESKSVTGMKNVELFIGLSQNFNKFERFLKPDVSTLWSVNKSAVYRQRIRNSATRNNISRSMLVSEDGIFANISETLRADYVVTLGGWSNYKSFVDLGRPSNSVYALGIGFLNDSPAKKYQAGKNILMFVGTLSFRKGIHLIEPLLQHLKNIAPDTKLVVIGRSQNDYWQEYFDKLKVNYPQNLLWEQDYLEPGTKRWDDIFSKIAFGIFPSFEEGAAGSLVQMIHEGIPVLFSNESGIEFTQNSIPLTMDNQLDWLGRISELIFSTVSFRESMLREQQYLLESNGIGMPQLKRVLSRISDGSLWPKISDPSNLLKINSNHGDSEFSVMTTRNDSFAGSKMIYQGAQSLDYEDLARIGVMTLDRYPRLTDILVENQNRLDGLLISSVGLKNHTGETEEAMTLTVLDNQVPGRALSEFLTALSFQFLDKLVRKYNSFRVGRRRSFSVYLKKIHDI